MKVGGKFGRLLAHIVPSCYLEKGILFWVAHQPSLCRTQPGQLYLAVMKKVLGDKVTEKQEPDHVGYPDTLNFTPSRHYSREIKHEPHI